MREWLKANGGPPAIILVGLASIPLNSKLLGVSLIVIGALYWIYRASWFPFTIAKKNEVSIARSDFEVVAQARSVVRSMGGLLGQHIRYRPSFHNENDEDIGSHAAWARGVNRSN